MENECLFHAEMVNEDGISGTAYVKGGLSLPVSDALSSEEGTNPEELFGLSWATCLNATLQALLKGRGIDAKSTVKTHVDMKREKEGRGFYFALKAEAAIESFTIEKTEVLLKSAHRRCPVSKIIGEYEHLKLQAVPFEK